ncbi:sensor histidine kinase [Enteractinococcus coprophilus]|uniref:Two-component system sensor histidine kinase DesK n=1 Tax=Enteractinococcus coprophilus TaxID=1027633 RepID=A0A543APB0_9MICC|nr:sensor histidine kinase [Enteractinococcus coprophilus]TQL74408.1 two-component system sensor histidine kinase DesK [Enteractinococcus coprophilus]
MNVASRILPTGQPGHLPEPPETPPERRAIIFTAGIWLVFLVWTVFGFLESTAPVLVQIAGWSALVAFPIVYLSSFLHPEPLTGVSRHVNTLLYSVVLIGLGVIMAQVTPTAIINIVPYLMATWIFNHRLVTGIIAVVVFFFAAVAVVALANFADYPNWFLASVGSPAIIMVFVRISIELGARQQQHSERLALATQREDLASTVHDVLGHSLTTITVKVQLAQRLLDTNLEAAKAELADIESLARRSLSEVRSAVTDLQHPDLAEQLNQAEKALTAAGLTFNRPEALPRLTLVQQQVFAWVIREAVTNVIRHAQAAMCTITVTPSQAHMILRIDDDGVGIAEQNPTNHHGLAGLLRRVRAAGGSLELSRLSPGTRVEVTL